MLRVVTDADGQLTAEVLSEHGPAPLSHSPLDNGCSDNFQTPMTLHDSDMREWYLNLTRRPSSAAGFGIRVAAGSVEDNNTNCDIPDRVAFNQTYLGLTSRSADITSTPACDANDGVNVADYGPIDEPGVLAVACTWFTFFTGEIHNADIRFDMDAPWTTEPGVGCIFEFDLEGVALHEWGHTVGFEHANPTEHPWLTMASQMQSCDDYARTWARGEAIVLNESY